MWKTGTSYTAVNGKVKRGILFGEESGGSSNHDIYRVTM